MARTDQETMTGPYGWQAVQWDGVATDRAYATECTATCRPYPVLGWVLRYDDEMETTRACPVIADNGYLGQWDAGMGFMVHEARDFILGYLAPGEEFVEADWLSMAEQAMQDRAAWKNRPVV